MTKPNENIDNREPNQHSNQINLEIPHECSFQLVYSKRFDVPFTVSKERCDFCFIDNLNTFLTQVTLLISQFGLLNTFKIACKILFGRKLYIASISNEIVHHGWITKGICKYYKVGSDDYVIGPIATSENVQGKGIGTFAIKMAINHLINTAPARVFIDTSNDNISCQHLITKCFFGKPVAVYLRGFLR